MISAFHRNSAMTLPISPAMFSKRLNSLATISSRQRLQAMTNALLTAAAIENSQNFCCCL